MIIAPSILNANNLDLKNEIQRAVDTGITRFHIDIMDGHFVPNLSFGPELVKDFKREFPMIKAEIHLMSDRPKTLIPAFVEAGADIIELHYESMSEEELNYWLDYLNSNGVKAGLVLNPETSVTVLNKFAAKLKQALIMTVHPGFGGQEFLPQSPDRIRKARKLLNQINPKIDLEVDGGVDEQTIVQAKDAGANIFVVGSYIYGQGIIADQIEKISRLLK